MAYFNNIRGKKTIQSTRSINSTLVIKNTLSKNSRIELTTLVLIGTDSCKK
jgi:hypothetical protein